MHRGDSDRMGRDYREMGSDWRMHHEREMGRDRDMDRGRYGERGGSRPGPCGPGIATTAVTSMKTAPGVA